MLAMVSFNWLLGEALEKLSRDEYAQLRASLPQLLLKEWKPETDEQPKNHIYQDVLIDLTTDGPLLARMNIHFDIKKFKNTYRAQGSGPDGSTYNLNIAIPNVGLLAVDEVLLIEDACTDRLQGELNDGWRILAICPPNAQRRPDYILGRTKGAR